MTSYRQFRNEIITRTDGQRMTNYESAKIECENEGMTAEELCKIWYEEEKENEDKRADVELERYATDEELEA